MDSVNGVTLRRIGTVGLLESNHYYVELEKPLNPDSFDGITDWSHCWLIGITKSGSVDMVLCEIIRIVKRRLYVNPLSSIPPDIVIVDIKPVHSLDIASG
jgi:tRNA (Thr-GGU) A37 N-methylase